MLSLFISDAMAQAAPAAQQANPMASFMPLIIIFVIFYFLMIRPQKKKMNDERALISGLNKGDEIFTKSGIIGTITGITDKIVTLEVSESVKFKMIKSEVAGPSSKLFEKKEEIKK